VSRSLWWGHGWTVVCCGVRGTEYNGPGLSPFEGGSSNRWYLKICGRETDQIQRALPPFLPLSNNLKGSNDKFT